MKKPKGQHPKRSAGDSNPKGASPADIGKQNNDEDESLPAPPSNSDHKQGALLKFWKQAIDIRADRAVELIFAFAIVIFAFLQWSTASSNNTSTSAQTDQLITAAKISALASQQNANAAASFADSTRKMNIGINNAVDRLNSQAESTSELAQAAAKQADQSAVQAEHSAQQLEILKSELTLSERPWIQASFVPLSFNYDPVNESQAIETKITIFNSGHSPATAMIVSVIPWMVSRFGVQQDASTLVNEACKQSENVRDPTATTVFPDAPIVTDQTVSFNKYELSIRRRDSALTGKIVAPAIVVCIAYKATFAPGNFYHTSYVLDLLTNGGGDLFDIGTNYPATQLSLRSHWMSSASVN